MQPIRSDNCFLMRKEGKIHVITDIWGICEVQDSSQIDPMKDCWELATTSQLCLSNDGIPFDLISPNQRVDEPENRFDEQAIKSEYESYNLNFGYLSVVCCNLLYNDQFSNRFNLLGAFLPIGCHLCKLPAISW